ncbi:MAG: hypothetical protein WA790_13860 [Sulfitobacter sp.]
MGRATPQIISDHGIIGQRGDFDANAQFYVHMPLSEIRDKLSDEQWSESLKISNVRNPFAVVLSAFSRGVKHGTFGPFANFDEERAAFNALTFRSRQSVGHHAGFFIDDEFVIDEVIFFEDLPAQIAKLCQRLDIKDAASLPHHEQSSEFRAGHSVPDYFSAEKAAAVIERFDWAFDRFGYSTNPADYSQKPMAVTDQIAQVRVC